MPTKQEGLAARHAMENQGKGSLLQYGLLAGMIFTGGIAGAVLQNTAGLTQMLAFFKFSRGAEGEADRYHIFGAHMHIVEVHLFI